MIDISKRLHQIARELDAITAALALQARSRTLEPGPRARVALEALRAFVAAQGGSVPHSDCAYELINNHGFGRSAAYDHVRRLVRRGLLAQDATHAFITLPADDVAALL